MKNFKKFFLASTLLTLSSANITLGMELKRTTQEQKQTIPTIIITPPDQLNPLTWAGYIERKQAARKSLAQKKARYSDYEQPPKSFVSPSSSSSSSSSSSAQPKQIQFHPIEQISTKITLNQNQICMLFYQIAHEIDKNPNDFYQALCTNWNIDKKIDFSNHSFKNDKEFKRIFLSLKSIWSQIKELNLENCNISKLPKKCNDTILTDLTALNLKKNNLESNEKIRIREEAFQDTYKTKIEFY